MSENTHIDQAAAASTPGTTIIEDAVVAKVAGIAVRDIEGVYALGGGAARLVGAVRDAMGSTDLTQGVSVEVGDTEVAVDVHIVAEYPVALQELSDRVRSAVATAMTELVGMDVAEINVTISDVHVPEEHVPGEDSPEAPAKERVR